MLPTKFQFIWLRGFRGEYENVKSLQTDVRPSDGNRSRCLWRGELKMKRGKNFFIV